MNLNDAANFKNAFSQELIGELIFNKSLNASRKISHLIITPNYRTSKIFIMMFCFNLSNEKAILYTCYAEQDFDVHVVSYEKGSALLRTTLKKYLQEKLG